MLKRSIGVIKSVVTGGYPFSLHQQWSFSGKLLIVKHHQKLFPFLFQHLYKSSIREMSWLWLVISTCIWEYLITQDHLYCWNNCLKKVPLPEVNFSQFRHHYTSLWTPIIKMNALHKISFINYLPSSKKLHFLLSPTFSLTS